MLLIANITLYEKPFTKCYISEQDLVFSDELDYKQLKVLRSSCSAIDLNKDDKSKKKSFRLVTNSYFLRPFLNECLNSETYKLNVLRKFSHRSGHLDLVYLSLYLETPDKEIIDYLWNFRISTLVWTRLEIENAFSWLSTLGGAYSALGDYFENCAEEAGRISVRQYKLALMLGDESLAARSNLYWALSLSQKGKLKQARYLVRQISKFAHKTKDRRLNRMCQGVWVKLRYLRDLKNNPNLNKYAGDACIENGIMMDSKDNSKSIC